MSDFLPDPEKQGSLTATDKAHENPALAPDMQSFPVLGVSHNALLWWEAAQENHPKAYGVRVYRYLLWIVSQGLPAGFESLRQYLEWKGNQGASASTISGYFYACKSAILDLEKTRTKEMPREEAEIACWTVERAILGIKLPKVMRGKRAKMIKGFKTEDLEKVIRAATPRVSCYIEFLSSTGLRVSEMTGLRIKNLRNYNRDFYELTVLGKGKKERSIKVQNILVARVRRVFSGRTWLFETRHGGPVNPDNVYKQLVKAFMEFSGTRLTPHNLRHFLATRLLREGYSTHAVAEHLGHSDPSTTAVSYDVSTVPDEAFLVQRERMRNRKTKPQKEMR